ncbi:MAG: hypothetical protein IT359_05870 [Gemmatimonadaceae bacterium]|nr:hypothetical protein [Gemmatimonadaceae bacterium]
MPSDPRVQLALDRLARPIGEFRSTVAGALAQAESFLAAEEPDESAHVARVGVELGEFARGRLDVARFAAVAAVRPALSVAHRDRLQRAIDVLRDVLARGVALHFVDVPAASSLVAAVDAALARAGRAFGAVLAIELLRGGRYDPAQHDGLLDTFAFRTWTKAERRFAPPLVVSVDGADLHIGGLADFLDGREKLVLVVRGASPPAPLVRLITPGTLVLQTADETGLDLVATTSGTAIAALVPREAAHFQHDPSRGREPWQRLSVWHMPAAPRSALGGMSAWQMQEDLRQLEALAAGSSAGAGVVRGGGEQGAEAVDVLARWLLGQADLQGMA